MSDPPTAAAAGQLLAELTSILSPAGPPSTVPVPAVEQSATALTSCQQQYGQAPTVTQVQSASQSSTTIQVVNLAAGLAAPLGPASGGAQPPVQAASQTVQLTWQLQIGCLFYCVDTQQVQQAQESATTVVVVPGQSIGSPQLVGSTPPSGSTSAVVTVVTQVIWQVQIGCLAWCYDSTQLQQATTQSTVVVVAAPPPGTGPPTPPGPPSAPTGPPPASTGPPAGPPPAPTDSPPTPSTPGDGTPAGASSGSGAAGASSGSGAAGASSGSGAAGASGGSSPEGAPGSAAPANPGSVPPHHGPVPVAWPRLGFPPVVARAWLTISAGRPAPAQPIVATSAAAGSESRSVAREPAPAATTVAGSPEHLAVRSIGRRPVRPAVSSGRAAPVAAIQADVNDRGAGKLLSVAALALVLLAAVSCFAIRRARAGAGLER